MVFPKPEHSRGQVNKAGEILRAYAQSTEAVPIEQLDEWNWAYAVLANWRACHNYPINTFQATLRSRLKAIDKEATVAQRLKRFPSIVLNVFSTSEHDPIAGAVARSAQSKAITAELRVPVIGIGAGPDTDGQMATRSMLALKLTVVTKRHSFHCFHYKLADGRPWIERDAQRSHVIELKRDGSLRRAAQL